MFALSQCRFSGRKGNANRREKRVYEYKDNYYLTSQKERYADESNDNR